MLVAGWFLGLLMRIALRCLWYTQRLPVVKKAEHQAAVYGVLVLVLMWFGHEGWAAIASVIAGAATERLRDDANQAAKAL